MASLVRLEEPVTAKSHRANPKRSHLKSRTGCRVCKIRRVKCDETRPFCQRCTSTGRTCEGYPVLLPTPPRPSSESHRLAPGTASTFTSLTLHRLSWGVLDDDAERRIFGYMRKRAIYDVSGYFESDLWDRLILRVSHTEPAVRHALLGFSSLCETYEEASRGRGCAAAVGDEHAHQVQFAMRQYNKAVGLLTSSLSAPEPQLEAILTSCLVLVWLEFTRNDLDAGLRHLRSGLKILDDFRQPGKSSALSSQLIDASLLRLFARLELQATIYGRPSFDFVPKRGGEAWSGVPASFSSLEQASLSLHALLGSVFRFIRSISHPDAKCRSGLEPLVVGRSGLPLAEATCRSLLQQLRSWYEAVRHSPAAAFESADARQPAAAMCLLHIYHRPVTIALETLFSQSQMVYDEYDGCFEQILTLAEQLIHNSQHMQSIIFLDMGVMAPLFYVVLRCRTLALRRKALALLALAPCREGMWYRQDVIEYANWKIGIEERGRAGLRETEPLPEEARVWNERMTEVVFDRQQKTVISFQWRGPDGIVKYGQEITDLSSRMGQLI
ncbi:hypothetical protein B0T14DRAFT_145713 [Immersiella caudata]|uniref:Zn(2)-C6 fungal-type domain-containing protein n=1 Tax=Immersiella caudata TaxID=314043 RepID=A0AA40C7W0_9PEZI|nr:hypothetical protein B0T14DRAFT_145713 [Immersiella caudata]